MCLPDGEKSLMIAVAIEYRRVTDRSTDRRTDARTNRLATEQSALCIASRGKNVNILKTGADDVPAEKQPVVHDSSFNVCEIRLFVYSYFTARQINQVCRQ